MKYLHLLQMQILDEMIFSLYWTYFNFIYFLFKIAAFPFQSWVLDVYRGAPMIITAYMASHLKLLYSHFLKSNS